MFSYPIDVIRFTLVYVIFCLYMMECFPVCVACVMCFVLLLFHRATSSSGTQKHEVLVFTSKYIITVGRGSTFV